jgi:hypothetical protein
MLNAFQRSRSSGRAPFVGSNLASRLAKEAEEEAVAAQMHKVKRVCKASTKASHGVESSGTLGRWILSLQSLHIREKACQHACTLP